MIAIVEIRNARLRMRSVISRAATRKIDRRAGVIARRLVEEVRQRRRLEAEVRDLAGRRASRDERSRSTPSVSSSRVPPGSAGEHARVLERRRPAAVPRNPTQVAPAGGGAQALELAVHHHAPVVDDDDVLADVLDEVELVAREQDRGAVARELAEDRRECLDAERVEPGERLVEHERDRIVHERGGELHALLVAVRQRVQPGVAALARPSRSSQRSTPAAAARRSRPDSRARYSSCAATRMCGYRPRSSGM